MLCVCVGDVMDVVFSVCIVERGAVCARILGSVSVSSCRCCMVASCGCSQCCIPHNLQFLNAGRGCKRRPYGRAILQSRSHDCLIGSHECLLQFTPSCRCECFYHL